MRLVFVVARVDGITTTQTTLHLAWTALRQGLAIRFIDAWDFGLSATGTIGAWCHSFEHCPENIETFHRLLLTRGANRQRVSLTTDDVLLMRMTPVPSAVLNFAYLARASGVRVYNPPEAIALTGPKSWLASLSNIKQPCTIVTSSLSEAMAFAREAPHGIVVKPVHAWGGAGASHIETPTDSALRTAMRDARSSKNRYAIVQHYLPLAVKGEKRLLWLDGELVGGYLRERGENVFQHK
jgi:glutathione synthase/RimK-type ligase-like ATP-grasp enzyme